MLHGLIVSHDFLAMLVRESFRDLSTEFGAIFISTSVGLVYRVKD
jgi:hypothetical protein